MIIEVPYMIYTSDWYSNETAKINTDKYIYFEIENRGCSDSDWWIIGHRKAEKYNKERHYYMDNLTGHGAHISDVAKFYIQVNEKVRTINVLHFYEKNDSILKFFKKVSSIVPKLELEKR